MARFMNAGEIQVFYQDVLHKKITTAEVAACLRLCEEQASRTRVATLDETAFICFSCHSSSPRKGGSMKDTVDAVNRLSEAIKAGARGSRVIGCIQDHSAISDNRYLLIVETPVSGNADEIPWYER